MKSKIKELLIKSRELISYEHKWGQYAKAYKCDENGCLEETSTTDPFASKWCAVGAVYKTFDRPEFNVDEFDAWTIRDPAIKALNSASKKFGKRSIVDLNDAENATHAKVLAAFDLAIDQQF